MSRYMYKLDSRQTVMQTVSTALTTRSPVSDMTLREGSPYSRSNLLIKIMFINCGEKPNTNTTK